MAALRFAPPRGAGEPGQAPVSRETPDLEPEGALQLALSRAISDLTDFRDRIDGGVRRRGEKYRVSPGEFGRAERVFRGGLEAVAEYRRRRPG